MVRDKYGHDFLYREPKLIADEPVDQDFTVTVATSAGECFYWAGYADNISDALEKALGERIVQW